MIKKISHALMSIFFDMSTYGDPKKNIYNPQDLTEHYAQEMVDSSLDGVYIATHYSDIAYTIEAYKYRSDRQHVDEYVDLLMKIVEQYGLLSHDDIALVSVPMHWTRRQSKLTKVKRLKNREHAFALRSGIQLPNIVILIDDIISTGSTANACAKILKSAGVERVYSVFIASNQ